MNASALLVGFVALAVVTSLAIGIFSMVRDGEVAHFGSAGWMGWRVGLQLLAVVLVFAMMNGAH